MHNVWLDDDDDDDDDENDADDEQHEKFKLLKTDLFKKKTSSSSSKKKKKSVANADSYHSTAKSSSSGNTNVHESTLSSPPSASSKRKNSRRSFNFISGLAGNSETDSVLDKIKHSFSNKQESSRLDTIPAGVTSTSSSSFIGRRTSLMNLRSKTSQSTFMTDDTASIMTSSTSATNKRSSMMFAHSIAPTMSSISSHSSSTPNKHSGASASYKPQNSSAKSKLFGLLKGGNRSSHSSSGMGVNHVYGSPYTGASAGHNNESSFSHSSKAAALDKSKISSPLNFTHTAHAGASLFASEVEPVTTTTTMASTSTAMSSFHMPAPHRHDRVTMENESRRISTPPPTALASASAAVFTTAATTAALSSTSSSFVGSPNMGATSINDTGSISTTSVDDYSPISGSTKYHRAFFTQLNGVAAGSRLSFQGTESVTMLDDVAGNGLTPGAGAAGMISMPHRSIFKRQSVDSLASLERHIGPGSGNTNRYSLPPGMPFSSASLRARSRLSINSTLSVDSVVSSIDRMSTPPLPMPLVQPQVLPDGMALERVHEEGWF
ncbi:hypothetical protein D0Z00_002416 [Geotrichum galactomycetum]|uniref:Uncharacterized protein n=1 Tax=Geotrichum galactomycetum TaxID=27317 RepID=A0ACB6V464_9ASCO|nr:hypothetical protein D0Z00_002416 [Geotrichum candidum]